MRTRRNLRWSAVVVGLLAMALLGQGSAGAQGFAVNRYEPTSAGSWFFAVEHPWYSSTRYFAGGLTLNWAEDPLVTTNRNITRDYYESDEILEDQLLLHLDLAASLFDRLHISASMPFTLRESGGPVFPNGQAGVSPVGFAVGDPRVGVFGRIYGQPDREVFSVSAGAHVWIPIGAEDQHAGDSSVRVMPKVIVGGTAEWLRWSVNLAYLYRPDATIGTNPPGPENTAGQQIQAAAAVAIADPGRNLSIGPEVVVNSRLSNLFASGYWDMEAYIGVKYWLLKQIMIGAAGGMAFFVQPGTPLYRGLFTIAYAPKYVPPPPPPPPPDADKDGIPDREDACPERPGERSIDPKKNGCPPPPPDTDKDGIPDPEDICSLEPVGPTPEPGKKGCPARDRDKDKVFDYQDVCPDTAAGDHPDPARKGCPAVDTDGDGLYDPDDKCPAEPQGLSPDPERPGCPAPDKDKDSVVDKDDACPDKVGAPNPDPKKNGCPGLVEVKGGQIVILQQVFFATGKDKILPKSFPLLTAVGDVLRAQPQIKRVAVEGHTDNAGKPQKNKDLSQRRADSVMKWLVANGVAAERLEAHGYGQERPIADNKSSKGRGLNRRVEFHIVDPAPGAASGAPLGAPR